MNCREFEEVVIVLADDRLMDALVRQQAIRHAADCGICAARLIDERVLALRSRDLTENSIERPGAKRRIEIQKNDFDGQLRTAGSSVVIPMPIRTVVNPIPMQKWFGRFELVAAASVLLMVVLGVLFWINGQTSTPKNFIAADFRNRVTASGGVSASGYVQTRAGIDDRAKSYGKKSSRLSAHRYRSFIENGRIGPPERGLTANYFPSAYKIGKKTIEDGVVVRVEVARAALISMGLSVGIEQPDELVKADVMMGVDGIPIGIRLIQ